MIKKNNEVREFVIDEVVDRFTKLVIPISRLEDIAAEVQQSTESRFSVEVDSEAVSQIVRLFYLAQAWPEEIEWNSEPLFDQLEKNFLEYFPSTNPLQVERLVSDSVIVQKVWSYLFDHSTSEIIDNCESLKYSDKYENCLETWRLDELSKHINFLSKVLFSPSEPTLKALTN